MLHRRPISVRMLEVTLAYVHFDFVLTASDWRRVICFIRMTFNNVWAINLVQKRTDRQTDRHTYTRAHRK